MGGRGSKFTPGAGGASASRKEGSGAEKSCQGEYKGSAGSQALLSQKETPVSASPATETQKPNEALVGEKKEEISAASEAVEVATQVPTEVVVAAAETATPPVVAASAEAAVAASEAPKAATEPLTSPAESAASASEQKPLEPNTNETNADQSQSQSQSQPQEKKEEKDIQETSQSAQGSEQAAEGLIKESVQVSKTQEEAKLESTPHPDPVDAKLAEVEQKPREETNQSQVSESKPTESAQTSSTQKVDVIPESALPQAPLPVEGSEVPKESPEVAQTTETALLPTSEGVTTAEAKSEETGQCTKDMKKCESAAETASPSTPAVSAKLEAPQPQPQSVPVAAPLESSSEAPARVSNQPQEELGSKQNKDHPVLETQKDEVKTEEKEGEKTGTSVEVNQPSLDEPQPAEAEGNKKEPEQVIDTKTEKATETEKAPVDDKSEGQSGDAKEQPLVEGNAPGSEIVILEEVVEKKNNSLSSDGPPVVPVADVLSTAQPSAEAAVDLPIPASPTSVPPASTSEAEVAGAIPDGGPSAAEQTTETPSTEETK